MRYLMTLAMVMAFSVPVTVATTTPAGASMKSKYDNIQCEKRNGRNSEKCKRC